ncbi:MAG TPA: hypothetical protein VMG98_11220 [Verrucomicrobiae bacterium]|nr:hypothetical protein [Verrucomicrobiae bacterium]
MNRVLLLLFVASAALVACGGGGRGLVPSPSSSATPGTVTIVPPKIPIRGLIDMQDIAWHNTDNATPTPFTTSYISMFPGSFGGIVINETWADLQPTQGGAIVTTAIDNDLTEVQAYNNLSDVTQSSPVSVKLRIYAGSNAPHWAKSLPGGPVTIYRNPAGCNGLTDSCPLTVGPYWTTAYIDAWRSFQAQVAAKYDSNPSIVAVAVTSCAEQTDEPFVASTGPVSKANLVAAGLTDTLQESCLSGAMTDYAAWANTDIDFTFNSYNKLGGGLDTAFSQSVMQACRAAVGSRCVLDNHALQTPITSDPQIYVDIQAMGGLINFQTQSPQGMGCIWPETITQGIILGARAIEVWPEAKYQGFTTLTVPEVAELSGLFYSPAPASTPVPQPLPAPCSGFN